MYAKQTWKIKIQKLLLSILLILAGTVTTTHAEPLAVKSTFSVTYFDVGQGDAALVECDGFYMLIDGGDSSQSSKMYAVLKEREIDTLEYVVCTHPHADHAGGLAGALNAATVKTALSAVETSDNAAYQKFENALTKQNKTVTVPEVGDTYSLGSATIEILGPTDRNSVLSVNNQSLVFQIEYGETSFLFTGDAEQEEQQLLMFNDYKALKSTVLKSAHHGSSNGASYAWVKAVQPEVTVISCGTGNSYGHPHEELLNLFKQDGSEVYRTDLQGDITITSDGDTVEVHTDRVADSDVWMPGVTSETPTSTTTSTPLNYVLNTHTMKFHKPNCSSANTIKQSNRKDVSMAREELLAQGYVPCKRCNP